MDVSILCSFRITVVLGVFAVVGHCAVTRPCWPHLVAGRISGYTCNLTLDGVSSIPRHLIALRMISADTPLHSQGDLTLPPLPQLELLEYDVTRSIDVPSRPFVHLHVLNQLQLFHVASSDFRYELKAGVFDGLQELRRLILSDLGLEALPTGVFNGLETLRILELNHNRLSRIPNEIFSHCRELGILVLSWNSIHDLGLDSWHGLSGLRTLDLSSNALSVLNASSFTGLTNLKSLDLTRNELEEIDTHTFADLDKLQTLALNDNKLVFLAGETVEENIDTRPTPSESGGIRQGSFRGLSLLRTLEINRNYITSVHTHTFEGLGSLRRLELSENRIESLSEDCFKFLPSLAELDLSSNRLTTIGRQFSSIFRRLSWVDLAYNPWRCDCEIHWLASWLSSTSVTDTNSADINNLEHTRCSTPIDNVQLTHVYGNRSLECEESIEEEPWTVDSDELSTQIIKEPVDEFSDSQQSSSQHTTEVTWSVTSGINPRTMNVPLPTNEVTSVKLSTDSDIIGTTSALSSAVEEITGISCEETLEQHTLNFGNPSHTESTEKESTRMMNSHALTGYLTSLTELTTRTKLPQTVLHTVTESIQMLDTLLNTETTNAEMKTCDTLLSSVTENLKALDSLLLSTVATIKKLNTLLMTTAQNIETTQAQVKCTSPERQRNNSVNRTIPSIILFLAALCIIIDVLI